MTNIGIIGVGNIASTIINGIANSPLKNKIKMYGFNGNHKGDKLIQLESENKITSVNSNEELIKKSDYIIFCLKPNVVHSVLQSIEKSLITDNKVFMSVAAGIKLNEYENDLSNKVKFIRVMPNINAAVGEGMVALAPNKNITNDELDFATNLFKQSGEVEILNESLFDIYTAIAGSFPAAIFMLIDSVANVGLEYGLKKEIANKIATQMVLGSAKFAKKEAVDKNQNIRSLMDVVCSPAGTTINGVWRLEENGFSNAIEKAVIAMMSPKQKK